MTSAGTETDPLGEVAILSVCELQELPVRSSLEPVPSVDMRSLVSTGKSREQTRGPFFYGGKGRVGRSCC